MNLGFEPRGCTTAMGILPHRDAAAALDLAFSLDVPFWPQLPNLTFAEDTYVQTAKGFPGITADFEELTLRFSEELFMEGLGSYIEEEEGSDLFAVKEGDSLTYEAFRARVAEHPGGLGASELLAIRGQFMGPISLCLKVTDADKKPIIYRDEVRELVIRHIAAKVNRHLRDLRELHPHAFVWVDEPGLEILFTGIAGYSAERARADLDLFTSLLEGPRGVHLCGNPDWDFLLHADIDLLSFNAYGTANIMEGYADSIGAMLQRGGVIAWGIVPTNFADVEGENAESLLERLSVLWKKLAERGVDAERLLAQSMITPATCCLVNPDLTATVERSFETVRRLSAMLLAD